MKILDCTLRDGGYYTNWDFEKSIVKSYIKAANALPIDYLEVGYRNKPSVEYLGKYGYCPVYELRDLRARISKKLAVMLNEKSVLPKDLETLLLPIQGLVDMVRLAIDPKNFERAIILAEAVKKMGFEVGFNAMYMSKWKNDHEFLSKLSAIDGISDLFCMVDSYGGISPQEVEELLAIVRTKTKCPIGFHGHNNLELSLINTLTAINSGVDFVDATILGMGRGAGNLKMELLLSYLNKSQNMNIDFNILGEVITAFSPLYEKFKWGTNLPYMLSGANSIPQKEVMDWVTNRVYSFNSIVRALDNRKENLKDNAKFPILPFTHYDNILIVGGGENADFHEEGIKEFIKLQKSFAMVFATARNAAQYKDVSCPKYYCLVGSEGRRLSKIVMNEKFNDVCVLPPYPRTMGTDVPSKFQNNTFELESFDFEDVRYKDSCTALALQVSLFLQAANVYMVGYDGYPGSILSEKEVALTNENREVFQLYKAKTGKDIISLTPSLYKELKVQSVYQYI